MKELYRRKVVPMKIEKRLFRHLTFLRNPVQELEPLQAIQTIALPDTIGSLGAIIYN